MKWEQKERKREKEREKRSSRSIFVPRLITIFLNDDATFIRGTERRRGRRRFRRKSKESLCSTARLARVTISVTTPNIISLNIERTRPSRAFVFRRRDHGEGSFSLVVRWQPVFPLSLPTSRHLSWLLAMDPRYLFKVFSLCPSTFATRPIVYLTRRVYVYPALFMAVAVCYPRRNRCNADSLFEISRGCPFVDKRPGSCRTSGSDNAD